MNIGEANDTVRLLRALGDAAAAGLLPEGFPDEATRQAAQRLAGRAGKSLMLSPAHLLPARLAPSGEPPVTGQ